MLDWFRGLIAADDEQTPNARPVTRSPRLQQAQPEPASTAIRGLDFEAAIKAHQAWKTRLSNLVEGQTEGGERLDYRVVCSDDQCVLGRWIHGEGHAVFSGLPLFDAVRVTHAQFHRQAGAVVSAVDAGRIDEARLLLRTDYQRASIRVQGRLAELFLSTTADPRGDLAA
jgi:hypothetical protein